MSYFKFCLTIHLIIFCHILVLAQTSNKQKFTDEIPTACGTITMELSTAHQTSGETIIIIISRLGVREKNKKLHPLRLNRAKDFLVQEWNRSPETIVIAEGEKTKGLATIEIYGNGVLKGIVKIKKNGSLITQCDSE